VDDLDLVVNVDPPTDHKDYLHRGGRTARAGGSGSVVTLVLPEQKRDVNQLMSAAGIRPRTTRVTSTAPELTTITGAREPSGVAVVLEPAQPEQPAAKSAGRPSRRSRSGGGAAAGNRGTRSGAQSPAKATARPSRRTASEAGTGTGTGTGTKTGGGRTGAKPATKPTSRTGGKPAGRTGATPATKSGRPAASRRRSGTRSGGDQG
ncbi:DEAD/DEAH box helicase, partial [Streptomyces sp. SID4985]|nr:DEAD/DEAH box helicase [Streptomyces sp. SID4985]